VLEVLEKSPGVIVDRNGGISLMGKTGVLVLIDDKPTYLGAAELTNLLGGMSSSQVDQIELITNPSAKYDAQGNAGVINIKTKKNKQRGFNGNLSTSYGQGYYPKSNNSLVLNYRDGRFNTYLTYSSNYTKNYTRLYALREYFNQNDQLESRLDQPTLLLHQSFNNTLKTGFDYYLSEKTTLGLGLTGITNRRKGSGNARVAWENPQGRVDSSIVTNSNSSARFQSGGFNVYGKHNFNKKQQLSIDFDWLDYDINNRQLFNNTLLAKDGYNEGARGYLPSLLNITSLKVDYSWQMGDNAKWEAGYKNSHIDTDNTADYEIGNGTVWFQDYGKTNRFLYQESIHALYSTYEQKWNRLSLQMGLRYERTNYDAHQLGNAERPDSAFSRKYAGFFPSGYLSYQLDSSHVLTLTAGRRLDRPEFQRLNPFVNIINKYTHERGNPFFQPQFTWNLELSHQYKDWLSTAISYSFIRNYFSQLFLSDGEDILIYTRGNVGKMYNLGFSIAANFSPYKWWSFNGQVIFNQKEFVGFQGNDYTSSVAQLNFSVNNQFKLGKVYSGEIAGTYTTRSRNDIQEIVYDSGQLSVGIARPVLKKQGTLKLSVRDILHTRIMEGLTDFPDAEEYFFQYWDTRVLNLAFSYRFGKPLKSARRSGGAASDEMERVGN
jgi:outer membrane receptor protein involved in Fe transport